LPRVPLLVRAAHLNVYLGVHREIGSPVDRALHRARLPGSVEDTPDAYLYVARALDCVTELGGAEVAMALGFVAARRMTLADLRPEFQRAIRNAPSGFERLQAIVRHASREDGALRSGIIDEGENVRVLCDLAGFHLSPALAYSEWLQLKAIISVVRSFAGSNWCPEEMTFVASRTPPDAAAEEFPNTRTLTSQPHTSILVKRPLLALPCPPETVAEPGHAGDFEAGDAGFDAAAAVREIVKPYLATRALHLSEVAEIFGMSERTLQRRLSELGLSYVRLVAEARYQVACELLHSRDPSITEVAMAAGYENASHFSRAFRRMTGASPREFRKSHET
jgi:AraC-like DNA-binding protein